MTELLGALVAEYAPATAPAVETAPGVKLPEGKNFFVTVPILKVGARSRNASTGKWNHEQVTHIVNEINTKRPEGGIGHVPAHERASRYDLPALRWVGAQVVGDTAWAKAYVPESRGEVREYFEDAAETGARVGTSVYGRKGRRGLADMVLESIDLGHPDRLGLDDAAAVPNITSEMESEETDMPEPTNTEATTQADEVVSEIAVINRVLGTDHKSAADLVAEYQQAVSRNTVLDGIVSEMGWESDTALQDAKVTMTELNALRRMQLVSEIDAMLGEKCEKNPGLQPILRDYIVQEQDGRDVALVADLDAATVRVDELFERDHIKSLAKSLVAETRGPGVNGVSSGEANANGKADINTAPTPEEAQAMFAEAGVRP